jgi:hypothetical protein
VADSGQPDLYAPDAPQAEGDALMDVVDDRLDAGPAERRVAEQRPRGLGQLVGIVAPPGLLTISADFTVADSGQPDLYAPDAPQLAVARRDRRVEPDLVRGQEVAAAGRMDAQHQQHRGRPPPGLLTISADFTVADSGQPDLYAPDAPQLAVEDLPEAWA